MGGQYDKSGTVHKEKYFSFYIHLQIDTEKLITIIKNEFEMTIDIENLIDEIDADHSGEIDYYEFKALLKTSYAS